MNVNFQNAALGITAGLVTQFPNDARPQIVLSGRSNVGKSSLINTILDRKALARVSSAPGKTITVNFYDIDKKIWLVDLPGYGFAKRAAGEKAKWSELTEGFITSECEKRLVLQLIDMKVGPTDDDHMMLDWLESNGVPYIIVATKSDKLNKTDYTCSLNNLKQICPGTIPFSSLNKTGKNEIRNTILGFVNGGQNAD